MNIIETLQQLLFQFPKINQICNTVHIDFTDNNDSYGLALINDVKLHEDVLGNETRQSSFVLYAVFQALNDFDRLSNSGTLLELQHLLEVQKGQTFTANEQNAIVNKITCSNGMLFEIPLGNETCGWKYQLQINVEYKIESEE